MSSLQWFLTPYEFSPAVLLASLLAAGWYGFGLVRCARSGPVPGAWRRLAYLTAILLIYAVLQTRFDYWAQHMFFLHRLQQFVLHYLAPILVTAAAPGRVLAAALPQHFTRHRPPLGDVPPLRLVRHVLLDPVIAVAFFAGLVVLWVIPPVHSYAMLSAPLYAVMNWSMLISGLIFWGLILDPRSPRRNGVLGYGSRIAALFAVIASQGAVSAAIGLSVGNLYPIYAVCGRLWPLNPMTDQKLGGMVGFLAALTCIAAVLTIFHRMLGDESARKATRADADTGGPGHQAPGPVSSPQPGIPGGAQDP